jgi:hypothetical protein
LDHLIDLIEVRRQLVAMRSQHSHDQNVTALLNKLLGKLAYLHEPRDRRHAERLVRAISKALQTIEKINQGE